ncbi:ABC transporter permease [Leucobacter weissii]|uniref:ABC transporter permease n=1 Tax=Leucobacter weissii TaxID=1983706 RepID=A0A939MM34_9MICO|nr:ABC transporter permease [Leucobacter weissii]
MTAAVLRVAGRIGAALVALLGASLISFVFLRALPSNPARLILGRFASDEAIADLERELGLHLPPWQQYLQYIGDFVTGDWGHSYAAGVPVRELLLSRLPASLELGLFAFTGALVGAALTALLVSYRRRKWLDRTVQGGTAVGLGMPEFWLATLLLVVFSERLGWFPLPEGRLSQGAAPPPEVTGFTTVDAILSGDAPLFLDALHHLILPAIALGLFSYCYLTRLLRSNLLEVAHQPYLLVHQAFGRTRWSAFWRSGLPNAMGSTIAAAGITLGQLVAGAVLVESVFQWPGIGSLIVTGIQTQDYSVVQSFILLTAAGYIAINLIADLIVSRLDPRSAQAVVRMGM